MHLRLHEKEFKSFADLLMCSQKNSRRWAPIFTEGKLVFFWDRVPHKSQPDRFGAHLSNDVITTSILLPSAPIIIWRILSVHIPLISPHWNLRWAARVVARGRSVRTDGASRHHVPFHHCRWAFRGNNVVSLWHYYYPDVLTVSFLPSYSLTHRSY